jgi:NADH dehydrogenase (ubiquinone) 1 alpha subcomplex subunit 7
MSTRSPPNPALPGGVHHKLSANAYAERDGRRNVVPPIEIVADATKMIGTDE